jgi:hypothetical protein
MVPVKLPSVDLQNEAEHLVKGEGPWTPYSSSSTEDVSVRRLPQ